MGLSGLLEVPLCYMARVKWGQACIAWGEGSLLWYNTSMKATFRPPTWSRRTCNHDLNCVPSREESIHQVPVRLGRDAVATSIRVCPVCGCFGASMAKLEASRDCKAHWAGNSHLRFGEKQCWPLFTWLSKSGTVTALIPLTLICMFLFCS